MPTIIRAGIVSATLRAARVRICASDSPISAFTAVAKGAKLNQITKVRKKANQVKCKMRCRPVNDHIPATDSIPPEIQIHCKASSSSRHCNSDYKPDVELCGNSATRSRYCPKMSDVKSLPEANISKRLLKSQQLRIRMKFYQ